MFSLGQLYGEELYSGWSPSIENRDDFIFTIYEKVGRTSLRAYVWEFYVDIDGQWFSLSNGTTKEGVISFNLNDYNLQYTDNKFKVIITNKNTNVIVNDSVFWYSYTTYLNQFNEYWFEKTIHDRLEGGSGGGEVKYIEKKMKIVVNKVTTSSEIIDININEMKEISC